MWITQEPKKVALWNKRHIYIYIYIYVVRQLRVNRLETLQHGLTGLPFPVHLAFKNDTRVLQVGSRDRSLFKKRRQITLCQHLEAASKNLLGQKMQSSRIFHGIKVKTLEAVTSFNYRPAKPGQGVKMMALGRNTNTGEQEEQVLYVQTHCHKSDKYRVTKKKRELLKKPNKNWRNPRKKTYWQKLNHYNLTFKRQ